MYATALPEVSDRMDDRQFMIRSREIKSESDSDNLSAMRELESALRRENDDLRINKSISNVRILNNLF